VLAVPRLWQVIPWHLPYNWGKSDMWHISFLSYFYVFVVVKLLMGLLNPKHVANILNKKSWLPINFCFRDGQEAKIACEGNTFHADERINVGGHFEWLVMKKGMLLKFILETYTVGGNSLDLVATGWGQGPIFPLCESGIGLSRFIKTT
jgi:hypothetical protein